MRLAVASSPHIKHEDDVKITMGDTLVALLPLLVMAFYYYGLRAVILTAVSVFSCVVFEFAYRKIQRKKNSLGDLSAIVTGVIIAYNIPATAPLWVPIAGAFFAVIIIKQLFGGLGKNIFNPALAAIAFLTVTWPGIMSTFPLPFTRLAKLRTPVNFETGRTALASLKSGLIPDNKLSEMLLGNRPGNLGTCAVIVIAAAALYLLYRRIISWHTPVAFIGTVALFAFLFPRCPSGRFDSVCFEIMSGSLIFVAIFMATEPVSSPVTKTARFLYGVLCGLLTVFLRYFGIYPEGAYFALLLLNPFAVMLDRLTWQLKVRGGRLIHAER